MKVISLVIAVVALSLCLGCAHLSSIDSQCGLTAAITQTVTKDLQGADYEQTLDQLIADKGLCVVEAAVDQIIASFSSSKAEPSVVLRHAIAWKSEHPAKT